MPSKFLISQAVSLIKASSYQAAENYLENAIASEPKVAIWHELLGLLYVTTTDGVRAEQALHQAIQLNPNSYLAWNNYGNALTLLLKYEDALIAYQKSLNLHSDFSDAYFNIGRLYRLLGDYKKSEIFLIKSIELNPNNPIYLSEMGLLCQGKHLHDSAISFFEKAIAIDPNFNGARHNLANSYFVLGEYRLAAVCLQILNASVGSSLGSLGLEMHCHMQTANWNDANKCLHIIENGLKNKKIIINPFHLLSQTDDIGLIELATESWLKTIVPNIDDKQRFLKNISHLKRVAFISGDFRTHPVGLLIRDLIERVCLSKNYEFYLISLRSSPGDPIYKSYSSMPQFFEMDGVSDIDFLKKIKELDIDVMFDMSGLTQDARMTLLGSSTAKRMINFLGYPAFIGKNTHDYIVMNDYVASELATSDAHESILLMDCAPLPRDPRLVPSDKNYSKADLGIKGDSFVFGSFCHVHKITEDLYKTWMTILELREDSVLYLGGINNAAKINLLEATRRLGVDENRIIFASRIDDLNDHLARLKVIDLFLDTYPYGGHTTVGDVISACVPVVSIGGGSIHSRVAAAQLIYLGLENCVVNSERDYVKKSLDLSRDQAELKKIRKLMQSINYRNEAEKYHQEFTRLLENI
jgi:predicted O-linked N-acetylglucosamine transferase (SPINDLY family)